MSWADKQLLLAALNLFLCGLIGWACVCRMAKMWAETTRLLTRWAYAAMFTAAGLSGWQRALIGEWPTWPQVASSAALLLFMWSGTRAWKDGPPDFAKSDKAPLEMELTRPPN